MFTEALKIKCGNREIDVQTLTYRALTCFKRGYYNCCLKDCDTALSMDPNSLRTLRYAARSAFQLKKYHRVINYCNTILRSDNNNEEFSDMLKMGKVRYKTGRMDTRLRLMKESDERRLLHTVQEKGVKLFAFKDNNYELKDLQPVEQRLTNRRVRIIQETRLRWPVILLQPEFEHLSYNTFNDDDV